MDCGHDARVLPFLWGSWTRGALFAVAGRMLVDCKHLKCFAMVIESVWICLPWMMHVWFHRNCRAVLFLCVCIFVCLVSVFFNSTSHVYLLRLIPKKKKVEKKLPGIYRNRTKNICFSKKTYVFFKYHLFEKFPMYEWCAYMFQSCFQQYPDEFDMNM